MKMKGGWMAVALSLAVVGLAAPAEGGVLPASTEMVTLDNGLRLVLVPWASPGITVYQTTVHVGSHDEVEADHTGFAHLFEHMMFRGTKRYPKPVYERAIQLAGADNSAFTWFDLTNFYILTPKQSLPKIIDIEADRFQHLDYSEEIFRTETGAVHGEYNKNASSPGQLMEEALLKTAFTQHTYAHSTMGFQADIVRMPGYYDYSRRFFKRFYTPDDCTIFVVGDFDRDEVVRLVKEAYGGWEGKRDQPKIPVEPEQTEPRSVHIDWPTATAPRMTIAYKIPAFTTKNVDAAALDVVRELVFGESSPLYRELVLEKKKALSIGAASGVFAPILRDPGLFEVEAVLTPETNFDEVQKAVTDALADVARGAIDAARVEAVRSHLRYGFLTEQESPLDMALTLAMFTAATGDPLLVEEHPKRLAEVTLDDVKRVAASFLVPARRTVVTLSHSEAGGGE